MANNDIQQLDMKESSRSEIEDMIRAQRSYFASDQTKDIAFRLDKLRKFKAGILRYQDRITDALWKDLHKSYEEAYQTKISIVIQEINYHKQQPVHTHMLVQLH